jgi:DNA-binding transcriptional ArsR family regulator
MNEVFPQAAAEPIGEPARAAMLIAPGRGPRDARAGELAWAARVSAPSASAHLAKLVTGGLLLVHREGRHRYYRIAGPEVGHAIEALGAISTVPRPARAPRPREAAPLYEARSCYDHLAGRIAVDLAGALEAAEVIRADGDRDYRLGRHGRAWLEGLGVDVDGLRRSRRTFARRCLDWTERRPHVAGALGAAPSPGS